MKFSDYEGIVDLQCGSFKGSAQIDWTVLAFQIIHEVCIHQNLLRESTTIRTSDKSIKKDGWKPCRRFYRNLILDFAAVQWGKNDDTPVNNHILLTAESEMNTSHWVEIWKEDQGDYHFSWGDYHWDFYKLLMVPSPLRLYFARVSGHRKTAKHERISMKDRMEILRKSITRLHRKYHGVGCRDGDQIFAVIFPSTWQKIGEREVWEMRL